MKTARSKVLLFCASGAMMLFFAGPASSGTASLSGDDFRFQATVGETNVLSISEPASNSIKVVDQGAALTAGPGCLQVSPSEALCFEPAFSLRGMSVEAGDGTDKITVDGRWGCCVGVYIYGEGGDDDVFSCIRGSRVGLSGGSGNDVLEVCNLGTQNPLLVNLLYGGRGNDVLRGGFGTDRLSGGPGRDLLRGKRGADRLQGGGGRDRLYAGRGRDVLRARDRTRDLVIAGGLGVDRARVDPIDPLVSIERLF